MLANDSVNVFLNTAVAEELSQFADTLEKSADFNSDLQKLVLKTIKEHKRIIFNGNGYDDAWVKEAEKRGLYNLKSTPEALVHILDEKNKKLLEKHGVYSESELVSRFEIHNENYSKIINIEAQTMIDMTKKLILPAGSKYAKELADTIVALDTAESGIDTTYQTSQLKKVSSLVGGISVKLQTLEQAVSDVKSVTGAGEVAMYFRNKVFGAMNELRANVDELEGFVPKSEWPMPDYADLLFSVR